MKIEAKKIDQALVAAGGNGKRLRAGGVDIPLAKSFIPVEGKPLLYWNLKGLVDAGINRLVLASDTPEKLHKAESVVDDLATDHNVRDAIFFQDQGLGTNGLPYYTSHLLDEEFVFDFGHNLTPVSHYDDLRKNKISGMVVFSGFAANGYSDHPEVYVNANTGVAQENPGANTTLLEVAAPFVLDQQWAAEIPSHDFTFARMVRERARRQDAVVVFNSSPVEIDTADDYARTYPVYQRITRNTY